MKRIVLTTKYIAALLAVSSLAAGPALADKPPWAGGGDSSEKKGKGHRDKGGERQSQQAPRVGVHFTDQHRVVIHEYFVSEFRGGRCPPGLAKKNNGCMPPGQAKKWRVGHPLPSDIVYYELPSTLVVKLGPPPPGHRYVRVAADILLIAVGTGMVVSAIQDLGRM